MTSSTLLDVSIPFPFVADSSTPLTVHEHLGVELGWDYARHGVAPPATYALQPSPLHDGLAAGTAAFGGRTQRAGIAVERWLQLRLHAWLRGLSVELFQVTPNYLQQLAVDHCPVLRTPLSADDRGGVARVRHDAGYAAGNLALLSEAAREARAALSADQVLDVARRLETAARRAAGRADDVVEAGLTAAQWSRLAVLCSFVVPLPHATAASLPLLVLPPNRLHLLNPIQALQAFTSRQLLTPGWSERARRIEGLLPSVAARRAFQLVLHALLPRFMEAGRGATPQQMRWALEDAWRDTRVLQRWTTFARLMSPARCLDLLARAERAQLCQPHVQSLPDDEATAGWSLDTRGYVPHARLMRRAPRSSRTGASGGFVGQPVPAAAAQAALPM